MASPWMVDRLRARGGKDFWMEKMKSVSLHAILAFSKPCCFVVL